MVCVFIEGYVCSQTLLLCQPVYKYYVNVIVAFVHPCFRSQESVLYRYSLFCYKHLICAHCIFYLCDFDSDITIGSSIQLVFNSRGK